jgi:16S rRNA G527 N7-methylase RsmG
MKVEELSVKLSIENAEEYLTLLDEVKCKINELEEACKRLNECKIKIYAGESEKTHQ